MSNTSEDWARMLRGDHPVARLEKQMYRILPSNPRCKVCYVPFGGTAGRVFQMMGRKPWKKNPTMCNVCQDYAEKHPGGAEIDLTMLFADVRGSTAIAEGISPTEFSAILNKFFKTATDVLIDHRAWIDKFVGDEIVAFFMPGGTLGKRHAAVGLEAARELLNATKDDGLPIGIGVHSGKAYVGTIGGEHISDVTAVGDDVNITARLASAAEARTIVATEATFLEAGISSDGFPRRDLQLKGKGSSVAVRILKG